MESERLVYLVRRRRTVLAELLELSRRQLVAAEQGRMNELMSLLAEKQPLLTKLRDDSSSLAEAESDDPDARIWDPPEQRAACRRQHDECEEMLRALMRMEAQCEQTLVASRQSLQEKLEQSQTAQQAVVGYAGADQKSTSGGRLDLSSQ